jgi:DNA-directed RNA polymerase specialized sigma24 family protein
MTPPEEQAFTEFVGARGPALLRLARLLVLDDGEAEDMLQVALLRLSRRWHRNLEAPDAYVRTVLANLAKDRARRRHLVPVPVEPDPKAPAYAGRDHAVEGMSEAQVAAALGVSAGTVKSNVAADCRSPMPTAPRPDRDR